MIITYYQFNQLILTENIALTDADFLDRIRSRWGIVSLEPCHVRFSYIPVFASPAHETLFRLQYGARLYQ